MRRKGEIMERAEKIQKLCLKMNVSEQEADAALRACGEDILDAALYLEALGRVRMPSGGAYSETPNMERGSLRIAVKLMIHARKITNDLIAI